MTALLLLASASAQERASSAAAAVARPAGIGDERRELACGVVRQHAAIAFATYSDAVAGAEALERAVAALVKNPSAEALSAARKAWLDARVPYLQSEAFRFYEGPIDRCEGMINAWPIDERYVDYVTDAKRSGIVGCSNRYRDLTPELLRSLNEKEGERNISVGFHAIEFLLWGEDLDPNGPGSRSHEDYRPEAENGARRGKYLAIVARLLVDDLRSVAREWAPDAPDTYRARFLEQEPEESLKAILKGLGTLTGPELAGERLTVAFATKEQEDEHSCFSDNTHVDVIFDVAGIQNVYLGRYTRTDGTRLPGPGVHDLLRRSDPVLADKLESQIAAALAAARAIPPPFDQAILGKDSSPGRVAIRAVIKALQAQAASIGQAALALGLELSLDTRRVR